MPTLQLDLIKTIVELGASSEPNEIVDPSTSQVLREAGVAIVTTYIEQLSLVGVVRDASPIFGANGGLWIGFNLTDIGRILASSEAQLRQAVADLIGGPKTEVSQAVAALQAECSQGQINELYREDFLATLNEIRVCFDAGCFIATIGLCGKILEVSLKEILLRNNIAFDPNTMIGAMIRIVRERVPNEYLDPALPNLVNIINASRNTAVHARERVSVPSRDQAIMVIFAARDVVRRNLSHLAQ